LTGGIPQLTASTARCEAEKEHRRPPPAHAFADTGKGTVTAPLLQVTPLVGVLIGTGWLSENEALDRHRVEHLVSAGLAELANWHRR
jgi:hypothetical protein